MLAIITHSSISDKVYCGRYYCKEHSAGSLYIDCANQKFEQELFEDYFQEAKQVFPKARNELLIYWIGVGLGYIFLCIIGGNSNEFAIFGALLLLGVAIWLNVKQKKLEKSIVAEIGEMKPGFTEFYKEWKKEKNKDMLKAGLALTGAIVVGAIADELSRGQRKREIEEAVRKAME
jgi:hypothetical protein